MAEELDRTLDDALDGEDLTPGALAAAADTTTTDTPAAKARAGGRKRRHKGPGIGAATVTLHARKYHPQPGATVLDAGARAESERGGESDLVIVAAEPGQGHDLEAKIRKALA